MALPNTNIIRALSSRNYRFFFTGQGISLIGTWMQSIAMSWLVYRLTGSTLLLGVVGFAGQIPSFVFAPIAGVLADRWNRRHILIGTQALAMIQAFITAGLTLTGVITVWHLIVLSIFLGLVNSFDIPARQSLVVLMVEKKEDLPNAIALNSFLFNGARLVGPTIAGILIALLGEGMCFLINAVSYIAVIIALLAMKINIGKREEQGSNIFRQLKEGISYAYNSGSIRTILFLSATFSIVGMPYTVLIPVIARDVLYGGADTYGFLITASGIGAVIGALYLAVRKSVEGLGNLLPVALGVFGLGLAALSQSRVFWISLPLMLLTGFGMMIQMASNNTILQTIVDDDKRGRVMSLYTMSFLGMAPFGSLLAGALASRIGAPGTIMWGGISCLLAAVLFAGKVSIIKGEIIRQTGKTTYKTGSL
ncbi:MFS transporter [Pelotomaculum propionicicum]|uniref:MFS transporter n=1 Tax=Pelotomaculum propionicicum TaxID=258475 RepID=UPI003B7B7E99